MALYFWVVWLHYSSTEWSKYSNCTVNSFNICQQWPIFKICWGYALPSSLSSTLNSSLWSLPDAIINARDTMQNPGQTRIFYNLGQTHLTRRKCDLDDPDDPDDPGDPTRFQPWCVCMYVRMYVCMYVAMYICIYITLSHLRSKGLANALILSKHNVSWSELE